MMIGQLLCYAALDYGKEALFLPHYGPEQRGGTANCSVTISDEPIYSPLVRYIDVLIAMNDPSLAKFENRVKPGGSILINSSLCTHAVQRKDVPADDIAAEIGSKKVANIVMLSAYAKVANLFSEAEIIGTVTKKLGRKVEFLPMNKEAVRRGMAAV